MELSLNRLYFDGITNNLKDQDEKEKKNHKEDPLLVASDKKILIVDDNLMNRKIFIGLLK